MRNKCIILILSILFSSSINSIAQEQNDKKSARNELRVSISDGIPINLVVGIGEAFGDITSQVISSVFFNQYSTKNIDSYTQGVPLPIGLQYSYRIEPFLSVGVDYSYLGFTDVKNYEVQNDNKDLMDIYRKKRYHFFHGTIRYDYMQKRNFALYGKLGAGFLFYNYSYVAKVNEVAENNRDSYGLAFSGQVNPIGISFGNKNIGGYAELGIGTKSILEVGIYTRF